MSTEFQPFQKIPRLKQNCVITEKIDGTNAQIVIQDGEITRIGSRSRWITPGKSTDNYGFAQWVHNNKHELLRLGDGTHFGEWWGNGIQRNYDLKEKRFSLFNVGRWRDQMSELPKCVSLVPTIYEGAFSDAAVDRALETLRRDGSFAAPGFIRPEGIIIYHVASRNLFKVTLEKDEAPKGAFAESIAA
jgi:hypothetical protein